MIVSVHTQVMHIQLLDSLADCVN